MSTNTPYTNSQNETTIMFNKYLGYATANVAYSSFQQPQASAIPFVPLKRLYTQDIPQNTDSFTGGSTGPFDTTIYNGNTITTYSNPNYIKKYTLQLQNHPSAPGLAFYYPYNGENLLEQGIPSNFGDGTSYNITVKNSNDTAINSNFYVYDTAAGIISFYNASNTVSADKLPVITFYRYEGTLGMIGGAGSTGPTGPSGDKYSTSTGNITIVPTPVDGGTGSVTVASGLSYIAGNSIIVVNSTNSDIKFNATTASYNINNGILDYKSITGVTGSFTSPDAPAVYNVSLGGVPGPNGSMGATGAIGPTGGIGPTGPSGDGLGQLNANIWGQYPIFIGGSTGWTASSQNIILGYNAGKSNQGPGCIAIGNNAGNSNQAQNGGNSIAIGTNAGQIFQAGIGGNTIAIGNSAGNLNQSSNSVAIGYYSGNSNQDAQSVAMGNNAGQTSQGYAAVAIGSYAGQSNQSASTVAIGVNAGLSNQGYGSIAIGNSAGQISQGNYAIAIGLSAGQTGQAANSIILNATANNLSSDSDAFFVKPIRNYENLTNTNPGSTGVLKYDANTGEIFYDTAIQPVQQSYDITDNDFSITNKSFSKVFNKSTTINANNIVMSLNGIPQNPISYTFGVEPVNTPVVKYVAVGAYTTNSSSLAYSYDGINWTPNSVVLGNFFGVDYGADNSGRGKWIAGGLSGGVPNLAYSWDGINWELINTPYLTDQINSVTFGGVTSTNPLGIWVACCGIPYNGTNNSNSSTIAYSNNGGINWALAVDSDGKTFTFGTTTRNSYMQNACWNGSMWVAVGGSGDSNDPNGIAYYATSSDGITWTAYSLENYFNTYNGVNDRYSIQAKCVAWNGNMWLIGGSNWANTYDSDFRSSNQTIIYSYDGQTWTLSNAVMSYIVNDITWNGQMWIAVGDNSNYLDQNVLSSLDGINWNALYFNTNSYSCSTICYSPRQVIVGYFNTSGSTTGLMNYNVYMAQGTIYTSSDPRSNFTTITANLFPSNTSNTSGCQKIAYMNKMPYTVTCSASGTTITQTTNLTTPLSIIAGQKLTVMSPTYYDEGVVPEVSLSFTYT